MGRGRAPALRRRRAAAQLLDRPAREPVAVVRRLLAVQAQDQRAARLALRARGTGFTAADVDAALSDERSLVVAWLGRGTLHLVSVEDYPWLLGLTGHLGLAVTRRRLPQLGVSEATAERAVRVVERALTDDGPLTRPLLAERLAAHGIPTAGQATPHLLALCALRGRIVLGPLRDGAHAFALTRDWLGIDPPAPLEGEARDAALRELARRYHAAHAPADAADLAAWSGLGLREARAGLAALADAPPDRAPEPVPPRLLPAFDPYLLGWKDRSFAVPERHARRVHPGGGMLRAVAAVDGRAVGTWSTRRRDGRLAIEIDPFGRLPAGAPAALRPEAADVARFEGLTLA